MSMTFKISARHENLHVTASGEFSLEEAKLSFLEIVEAIRHHKLGKVLIDGRDVTGTPRLLERFFYGHFAAEAVQGLRDRGWDGPALQFAYVLEEPVLHKFRLGETAAASRGMNVRAFDNADEAVDWLLPDPSELEVTADQSEQVHQKQPEHKAA